MTDLLRLTNLTVVGQREEDGTLILETRSKAPRVPRRCCLLHALDKNGTKRQRYRDHPIQGQPTILEVLRQRFRCSECGATHYEDLIDIDADRRLTVRFRTYLENQAIQMPFSTVATLNGVHETLVRRIFQERADRDLRGYEQRLGRHLGVHGTAQHEQRAVGDIASRSNRPRRLASHHHRHGRRWHAKNRHRDRCRHTHDRRPVWAARHGTSPTTRP